MKRFRLDILLTKNSSGSHHSININILQKIAWLSLLLFSLSSLNLKCKDEPTIQVIDDTKPGRRDYEWTVDTLELYNGDLFTPTRIWGSAANDVWITGSGDVSWNLLWHFDGVSWKKDSAQRNIAPAALWGFTSNDIWLGTVSNNFWHYNGTRWYEFSEHVLPGFKYNMIQGIWGRTPNDVYGVGAAMNDTTLKGIIMKFNGVQWTYMQIPNMLVGFTDIRQQSRSGLFFLEGNIVLSGIGTVCKLYTFDGRSLTEIYSSSDYPASVNEMNGEVYCVYGRRIYKYDDNQLQLWLDLSGTTFAGKIYGRSEKDFFSFASDRVRSYIQCAVGHYNGADFQNLFTLSTNFRVSCGFVFEKDVFFPCFSVTSNTSVVVHGKLKESN